MTRALTLKQRELLACMLDGLCMKQCARRMGVELGTVKAHRNELYKRLGVSTREQMMAKLMTPTDEARRLVEGR
jgi:DNA-binding CsgD family transcriptional regulator